jgi:hypothetical protein
MACGTGRMEYLRQKVVETSPGQLLISAPLRRDHPKRHYAVLPTIERQSVYRCVACGATRTTRMDVSPDPDYENDCRKNGDYDR